jgi:hypothetical protein
VSISWRLDADPRPAILVLPRAAESLDEAHAAIELWEFYKGRRLDPAQVLAVEVMMATRADGLWAAPTTGREESRQNGKGDEVEVVEFWGLVQRAERILHTIHDAVLLATEAQSRLLSVIDGHPDLRRLKARAWRGTGQQMIEMRNGGIIWYRTRTGGGARGVDEVDRIVVDEAQHAEEEHLAAITPTQLASANPQVNALGSAGIEGKSGWWWRLRKRALSDDPGDLGYVGHTAERVSLGADGRVARDAVVATDRKLWRQANPALVAGRVSESFFDEQFRTLGEALFAREHLCVWDAEPSTDDNAGPISLARWAELIDTNSSIAGEVSTAIDVSPDLKWTSVVSAGLRSDGHIHVEVGRRQPGTEWVVPFAQSNPQHGPYRVAGSGPAGFLLPLLTEAGVDVVNVPAGEVTQACARLITAVDGGTIHHLGSNEIAAALSNATIANRGDAQAWSRVKSSGDISALVAATIAVGGVSADESDPQIFF